MTRDKNYYGLYKDIEIRLVEFNFPVKWLDKGLFDDEDLITLATGIIRIRIAGSELFEDLGDYIWPLTMGFLDTLIIQEKERYWHTNSETAKNWKKERVIHLMDSPVELKVLVSGETLDLELRGGKKLLNNATGVDFVRYKSEVKRLAKD